ncbi:nucleotide-binding universal stress UspA family protein [Nocardioides sp. BE266]|uniref:universal stress protein n=1 Tax=Nocardioides sp. BE266 TaxID=2817725 RepID=UPI0028602160|nr:universal stress protein [Nocardioides sp. BE266]MDR7255144.1 nucleotide-binding universal stress UspA family protein [Nocardioides sp. BE266]
MDTTDTTAEPVTGPVVVGVTGPGREQAALRFAAELARRDGSPILLVHAVHQPYPAPPPSVLLAREAAVDVGPWVVQEVGRELKELTDGAVEARGVWREGPPARVLAEMSVGARLVVVQHRGAHGLRRLFTGSTVTGLAAHAACPVVSVPPDWRPGVTNDEVVVGVHEEGGPREVLEAGFTWAEATGVALRVVHAWRLDAVYDDIITQRVATEWREEQKRVLAEVVAGLESPHPGVRVVLEVRHQWPSDVLVDDSRAASLVVVGRHGPRSWAPHHVGSIARTVLREASSPVMVVPVG